MEKDKIDKLFKERDKLAKQLHLSREHQDREIAHVNLKWTPTISELTDRIQEIRSELFKLGVNLGDC